MADRGTWHSLSESLRTALEPLLEASLLTSVVLDYKPHPGVGGAAHIGTPRNDRHRTESPHRSEHRRERERSDNPAALDGATPSARDSSSSRPRLGDRASSRTGTGFSSYVSRTGGDKVGDVGAVASPTASIGGGFGRTRRGSVSKDTEGRTSSATSWGRT